MRYPFHGWTPYFLAKIFWDILAPKFSRRLADSFGRNCLMINFVLREKDTAGFPPPDGEIREFLREEQPFTGLDLAKQILSPEKNKLDEKMAMNEAALAKLDSISSGYMSSSQSGEWQNTAELTDERQLRRTKRELVQEMKKLEKEANNIS